jgi:hypothetical protein
MPITAYQCAHLSLGMSSLLSTLQDVTFRRRYHELSRLIRIANSRCRTWNWNTLVQRGIRASIQGCGPLYSDDVKLLFNLILSYALSVPHTT